MKIMWFNKIVFYEIYLPSFNDSSNNGVGDIKGIITKLDYLKDLGIGGIWITPFYKSPKIDNGYDIEDYYEVDEDFGCMSDFENLIIESHKRGIKVIIDLVLNHTSTKHKWFQESRKSTDNPFRDYYIWEKEIPNNWESFFSGSAWELDDLTNKYYYHAFSKETACLNWENPQVKKEMFKVISFWLDNGIDGIRFDVLNFLKVNRQLISYNNPLNTSNTQDHVYDKDQRGILNTIKEIVCFTKNWDNIFLLGEIGTEDLSMLSEYVGSDLLDAVLNFNIGSIDNIDVEKIAEILKKTNEEITYPTLFFTSHDTSRYISRLCNNNTEYAKVIAGLMLTAKGIPFIYQGDEIGMTDYIPKSKDDIKDIRALINYNLEYKKSKNKDKALIKANKMNRDLSRSPMQWNKSEVNYGFSSNTPWIGNTGNSIDFFHQKTDENSIFRFYKKLITFRNNNEIMQYGKYVNINQVDTALIIKREYKGKQLISILNFGGTIINYSITNGNLLFSTHKENRNHINPYEFSIYHL